MSVFHSPVVIAVAQRKGGVGKTTLAVLVAAELSRRGRRLTLIDTDPQRSACAWAEPGHLGLPVVPLNVANSGVADWAHTVRGYKQDLLVVDTAPSDQAVAASIALAKVVLIPCTPSGLDLDATIETLNIVSAVRARRTDELTVIVVPNRVDARTLEGRQIVEELESLGEFVGPPIRNRSAYVRAFSEGRSVADLPHAAAADDEIKSLCDVVGRALAPQALV